MNVNGVNNKVMPNKMKIYAAYWLYLVSPVDGDQL